MIAAMLLALGQAAAPAPATPAADPADSDIVVIARRMREWRGGFRADADGVTRNCRTSRSTGDAEIDALACQAALACYREMEPRFVAAIGAGGGRRAINARLDAISAEMEPCMERLHPPMVAALAERRAAARAAAR